MAQHNKTFYPYDPLPAQDLNDIVGFMNGIATGVNMEPGSVGPDTLAQSAVKADNIDFTSLPYFSSLASSSISLPANTETIIGTLNITIPGVYLLHGMGSSSGNDNLTVFRIRETNISGSVLSSQVGHGPFAQPAYPLAVATIVSPSTYVLTARPNNATNTSSYTRGIVATRIG